MTPQCGADRSPGLALNCAGSRRRRRRITPLRKSARFSAFAQLMRTAGALDRAATDILSGLGITAGAFFALLELQTVGDAGIAPSELARRLAVARRTATLYVDILVKHGWVSREAHPDDKRMILARLTALATSCWTGLR